MKEGNFFPDNMKKKNVTILTSNEIALISKIVIFKACITNDLYQQSQSSKIEKNLKK